jgi:enamine deaminase RidA (YjgF/YER057c/UK114 family)
VRDHQCKIARPGVQAAHGWPVVQPSGHRWHADGPPGACPLDEHGQTVGVGDVALQTRQAVANLIEALAQAGATMADVLKTTIYVASSDRSDLVAAWEVIHAAFGEHDAPSTLLGVAALGWPDQLVEIEAVATVGGSHHSL